MRLVGIVSDLHHDPGVYGNADLNEDDLKKRWAELAELGPTMQARSGRVPTSSIVTLSALVSASPALWSLTALLRTLSAPPLRRIGALPADNTASPYLPPKRTIVVPARAIRGLRLSTEDVLYGLFRSELELRRTFSAEGGNVDLWIVPLDVAQARFRHHGGDAGRFALGLHIPHPKDPQVLIPAREFSQILREQVLQDWVRAFEALGAETIVICDTTGIKSSNTLIASDGTASVAATLKMQYGNEIVRESNYDPGTFAPERARAGKYWIADFAAIESIMEGRIDGQQRAYRERIRVNVSFGLDAGVLKGFGAGVTGGFERTFDLAVQFYPKSTAR